MSRPLDHAAALEECKRLAHLWLDAPDAQLPGTSLTGEPRSARAGRRGDVCIQGVEASGTLVFSEERRDSIS